MNICLKSAFSKEHEMSATTYKYFLVKTVRQFQSFLELKTSPSIGISATFSVWASHFLNWIMTHLRSRM